MGLLYMEASAKENKNVTEVFLETLKRIPEDLTATSPTPAVTLTPNLSTVRPIA